MSAGTPVRAIRLSATLMAEIEITIARRNLWSREEPWNLSEFVRIAVTEKMKHMERSRQKRKSTTTTALESGQR